MEQLKDFLPSSTRCANSQNSAASNTSNYSTCSDNPNNAFRLDGNSQIVAGYVITNKETINESVFSNADYTVDLLEKNIDVLTEEDEAYRDCIDTLESDNQDDDSTKYLPLLQSTSNESKTKSTNQFYQNYLNANNLLKENEDESMKSNSNMQEVVTNFQRNEKRLTCVMEETELSCTTNSAFVRSEGPELLDCTGDLLVKTCDQIRNSEKDNKINGNSTKRVLFANKENIIGANCESNKTDKSVLKKSKNPCNLVIGKNLCSARIGKDINENCNNHNHNTTESFVMWEKYLESSRNVTERRTTRRSLSLIELNTVNESYGGDDECSTSYRTLDDTYLSDYSLNETSINIHSRKKMFSRKSKSCDDLLKEVKHLPHLIYQRFLKCLSKEIDNMLRQNVICTCQRSLKKRSNKENSAKASKCDIQGLASNKNSCAKDNQPSVNLSKPFSNESKLTPDRLLTSSYKNSLRISPKSPNKTPTRKMYGWKEIVSPVGEYIRGKRQSPFQSSPNKKKL